MKYTIAIPTYNNETTIVNAVLSALKQKFDEEYEVLVVNNASVDSTMELLVNLQKEYTFRIVDNSETVSLFENHNVCLNKALGDYVIFCHSDDLLYEDALKKLDLALSAYQYPEKIVCWGRSFFRDFYSSFSKVGELNEMVTGISAQQLFQNGGLTPSGTCYSRKSFVASGGFLPMRTNITPSDMSSMIKYSLDGAEFLMLDRLLFQREFASTANEVTQEDGFESFEHAIEELARILPPQTMETLFNNIDTFTTINLRYMLILSKYSPDDGLKNKFKAKFILKNPLSLRNKFVRKLVLEK